MLVFFSLTYCSHNATASAYDRQLEAALHAKEKEYYFTQSQLMQESTENMRSFKHDIDTHMAAIRHYATKGRLEDIVVYLSSLQKNRDKGEVYSDTGNIAIDSIINYKLINANSDNIALDVKLSAPPGLSFEPSDLATILGNLLDNALDALAKIEGDKALMLEIDYNKGELFIKVENTFNGKIKYASSSTGDEKQITTLKDGDVHGYRLKNIQRVVDKYDGVFKVRYTENVFTAQVQLYVDS